MIRRGLRLQAVLIAAVFLLGGCETIGGWFNSGGRVSKLKGTRINVMSMSEAVSQDPSVKDVPVQLPQPYTNAEWPAPGGYASNAMYHLAAPGPLKQVWEADIGEGASDKAKLTASPIVAGGRIFVMDAAAHVRAFDAATGMRLWKTQTIDGGRRSFLNRISFGMFGTNTKIDATRAFGGGIAYDDGKLFATNGFGDLVALDAASGKKLWGVNLGVPIFAAPAANGGRVFVSSQDNHFHAYSAADGRELWDHQGITESAGILVSTSAAVSGQFVVVPYTSGELFAMRVQNGRPAWSDMLTRTGNTTALSTLDDIAARPVIDRDFVFAVSHSGVMAAISVESGERVWSRDIGGIQTPWVAGDFLFVLNSDGQVMCLTRKEGRVKWISQLPRLIDPKDKDSDPVTWSGPVLVSDRLLVVSSSGKAASLSPYTGKILGEVELPSGTFLPPVVAGGMVYIVTDDADLVALK